jgi:hypothetical protein
MEGVEGSVTPRPHSTPEKDPVPIVQEAGWATEPVWNGAENLAPNETPDDYSTKNTQKYFKQFQ